MCGILQVSRSGYYDWAKREESKRGQQDRVLLTKIRQIHQDSKEAYGAIETWQTLKQLDTQCGKHRVARLRRQAGNRSMAQAQIQIGVQCPQHGPCGTQSFTLAVQGRFPRSDLGDGLTFIPTRSGWLYLA